MPTKFCTVINTSKCRSWVVRTHTLTIQDGGRSTCQRNCEIVICDPPFEPLWKNLEWWCSSTLSTVTSVKKFQMSNIEHGGGGHLEKIKSTHMWAAAWRILTKLSTTMGVDVVHSPDRYKCQISLKKIGAAPTFRNVWVTYVRNVLSDFVENWHSYTVRRSSPLRW